MGLPDWLTVEALKRRLGKELNADDVLLDELLLGALEQAQESPPLGTGRLLIPEPGLADDQTDSLEPVTKDVDVTGRRVIIPDARTVTAVEINGEPVTEYRVTTQDGLIVQIAFPRTLQDEYPWLWPSAAIEAPPENIEPAKARTIQVTGRFGFTQVPLALAEAIYSLAARRFYELNANLADTVRVGEGAAASVYYKQLPPTVSAAFEAFAIPAAIAGMS